MVLDMIRVKGGSPLRGTIRIHGAKNDALPILAATAAIRGRFILHNCPAILDIEIMRRILRELQISTVRRGSDLLVDSTQMQYAPVSPGLGGRLRASVLFLGALLASCGEAEIPSPGGDCFGQRPINYHIDAMRALGAVPEDGGRFRAAGGRLHGATVELPFPSVGATENILLAAVGADRPVRLIGAAREPEIESLAAFLTACGAEIRGIGTSCLTVHPGQRHGAEHTILPDRMETATYLCAAAATGGRIRLANTLPQLCAPVLAALRAAGCEVRTAEHTITISAERLHAIPPIVTAPYPGFPTDAQPLLTAALLRAEGVTVIEERVFDSRFRHIPALISMGADLETAGSLLKIRGVSRLHGAEAEVTDLRGGAAMLIAALAAEGESLLTNTRVLERGYEALAANLRSLGAEIAEA